MEQNYIRSLLKPNLVNDKLFKIPEPISSPKIRLICFPFAGGGANTFLPWIGKFNDQIELVLVEPPGRGTRISERPHSSMDQYINELVENLNIFTKVPYVVFGHSLGSRVAYELCCRLRALKVQLPEHFIASGSKAPHIKNEKKHIHNLPQNEFIEELAILNGTPKEILSNPELMEALSPLLRSDFKISETYQANITKMPFPILVLNGENDADITINQLMPWNDLSYEEYQLVHLPGDHFFINQCTNDVIENVLRITDKVINTVNNVKVLKKSTSSYVI
jgi:surfactin synthase thioesterase subunit